MRIKPNKFNLEDLMEDVKEDGEINLADVHVDRRTAQRTSTPQYLRLTELFTSKVSTPNGTMNYYSSTCKIVSGPTVSTYSPPFHIDCVGVVNLSTPETDQKFKEFILKKDPEAAVHVMNPDQESVALKVSIGPETTSSTYQPIWDKLYDFGGSETQDDENSLSPGTSLIMQVFDDIKAKCQACIPDINTQNKLCKPSEVSQLDHKVYNGKHMKVTEHPDYTPNIVDGEEVIPKDVCRINAKIRRPERQWENEEYKTPKQKSCEMYILDRTTGQPRLITNYLTDTFVYDGETIPIAGREWVANMILAVGVGKGTKGPIMRYRIKEMYLIAPTVTRNANTYIPKHMEEPESLFNLSNLCGETEVDNTPTFDEQEQSRGYETGVDKTEEETQQTLTMSSAFQNINNPVSGQDVVSEQPYVQAQAPVQQSPAQPQQTAVQQAPAQAQQPPVQQPVQQTHQYPPDQPDLTYQY